MQVNTYDLQRIMEAAQHADNLNIATKATTLLEWLRSLPDNVGHIGLEAQR